MALKPEDVRHWAIDDSLIQGKLNSFNNLKNGAVLSGTYNALRVKLNTYPPDPKSFSEPKRDISMGFFLVRSENKQVTIRVKYFAAQEICIVDRLYLAHETPKDLMEGN